MFDKTTKTKIGKRVIGMTCDKMTDLCVNDVQRGTEGILIVSFDGSELTRYGEVDEEVVRFIQSDEFVQTNYKQREQVYYYNNYTIFCKQNSKNSAIILKIIPKQNYRQQIFDIAFSPIVLLLGFLVGLFPILMFVSNIVTKPLGNVCQAMKKFKQGDFEQQVTVSTGDEVGEVAACFNQMVCDIKQLIETNYVIALKEKESELIALQAQINPHFLYNTLDSLYWQAQNAGNEEIAEDILALSQLFRLVLGEGKGVIPVRQEKDLITRYLHIQKMRFSKRLEYSIEMEEAILDYSIPKLILQPFVENAFVHGFENTDVIGQLIITGKENNDNFVFTIQDNGTGMR